MGNLLEGKTEPYRGSDEGSSEPCRQCGKPFAQWPHFGLISGQPSLLKVTVCFGCYTEYLKLCAS